MESNKADIAAGTRPLRIDIPNLAALPEAARRFVAAMGEDKVFAFHGKMGAGKTTFIKALCAALGSTDEVTSPTFALVNEYATPDGPLYHFDFYRLNNVAEAEDMGFDDYIFSGHICLLEWPELVSDLLPADTVHVNLWERADGSRVVELGSLSPFAQSHSATLDE